MRWVLVAFLALNLLAPMRYYVLDDPYDERFAWRMFSGIRFESCQVALSMQPTQSNSWVTLQPRQLFHAGYVTLLERRRPEAIDAALAHVCQNNPDAAQTRYQAQCRSVTGESRPLATQVLACGVQP